MQLESQQYCTIIAVRKNQTERPALSPSGNKKGSDNVKAVKKRVFEIIESAQENDRASRVFDLFLIGLILLNVILCIADTFQVPDSLRRLFSGVEVFSVAVFTIEYLLRVWTADLLYPRLGPIRARFRYIFSAMALVDLFAILPFYLPFFLPVDLRVLRALRVVRLLRLFKINRYTNALSTIASVFKRKASQLISSMLVVLLLMVITSVLMYNVENAAQPDVFENAFSGLWWSVATLTTVGYGDIYPITAAGKVLSGIIALLGIGLVAVPTGIVSAGFIETIGEDKREKDDKKQYCPYCGKKLDE